MSKGSTYRPVDRKKYDENFDRIFNKIDTAEDNTAIGTKAHQRFIPKDKEKSC